MYLSLDDLKLCPLFRQNPLNEVRMPNLRLVLKESSKFYGEYGHKVPEDQALRFYLLNHLVAELQANKARYEPLDSKEATLLHDYITEVELQARAMFTYLILICTRESRHAQMTSDLEGKLEKSHPNSFKVLKDVKGLGSSGAASYLLNTDVDTDVVDYCKLLKRCFYKAKWSSGFGGVAWGGIADVLYAFVAGDISAEMMIDQGYHLAHNNGAIFNKGMVYLMYTHDLKTILDIQRSGQIPNLINHPKALMKDIINQNHITKLEGLLKTHGHLVEPFPPVDFKKVMSLGSLGTYHSFVDGGSSTSNPEKQKTKAENNIKIFGNTYLDLTEMTR